MNEVALIPFFSPQSASIWPFIEVEDKGRRSGLRERVGTKTWVAMLCFPRSALRALSLSLGPCWPHAAPGDGASCPSYRRATTLLCINHCIALHPTICDALIYLHCNYPYEVNIVKLKKIFLSKLPPSHHPPLHQPLHRSLSYRWSPLITLCHPGPSYWREATLLLFGKTS